MQENYQYNQIFNAEAIIVKGFAKGEYENCVFNNCHFENHTFSNSQFIDCQFNDCNLSMVPLQQTVFRGVQFNHCKMLAMRFDTCQKNGLSVAFNSCMLQQSSFYQAQLPKTRFHQSTLQGVDFTEANLAGAIFSDCNLLQAIFYQTHLEKADFTTAVDYSINPESNRIAKAKFAATGLAGLLHKYSIVIT